MQTVSNRLVGHQGPGFQKVTMLQKNPSSNVRTFTYLQIKNIPETSPLGLYRVPHTPKHIAYFVVSDIYVFF